MEKSTRVVTNEVRFSFVNIFGEGKVDGAGKSKYSMMIMVPKPDTQTKEAMDRALANAIDKAFQGKQPPNLATPIHDGDGVRQNGAPYSKECKGCWVLNLSTKIKPEVLNSNKYPFESEAEVQKKVYSGAYGYVSINFYGYKVNGKQGVSAGLGHVMFSREGDPLGMPSAYTDFGAPESDFSR